MNESFLSLVWKYRLYNRDLTTTSGIPVTVIKTGEQHSNAGPDFFNARIRIGDTLWAGNVEIHVKASDWYRHNHQTDNAYNNVILHVVFEANTDIILPGMITIPTIDLSKYTNDDVIRSYSKIRSSGLFIPCGKNLHSVEPVVLSSWIDRMLVERLEHKSFIIENALTVSRNDWEEAFYLLLARNFGFNVNSGPFEMLARCLPRKLLLKHKGQLNQIEALLFGQSGLLNDEFEDSYPKMLQKEYQFLSTKYGLIPLEKHIWKFLRMRPANFPTIRISLFAALIMNNELSLASALGEGDISKIVQMIKVKPSHYWNNHFLFDKITGFGNRDLGLDSVNNIIINTIVPCLFYFGRMRGEQEVCDKAFELLKSIPPEKNKIITQWKQNNIKVLNAFDGQALIGLYRNFCSEKKCLNCSLGISILRRNE